MAENIYTDTPYHQRFMPQHLLLPAASAPVVAVRSRRWGAFAIVFAVMFGGVLGTGAQLSLKADATEPPFSTTGTGNMINNHLQAALDQESPKIKQLEDAQAASGIRVVDDQNLQDSISSIQIDIDASNYHEAKSETDKLNQNLSSWQQQLDQAIELRKKLPPGPPVQTLTAPILIYHYTPDDFEKQLLYLRDHGYETIDFDQLAAALTTGTKLPPKPVIITFDDGFSDQMKAFNLLKKYQMKATYYIIDGGAASKYCIGAGRRYDQGYSCGDGYLTWDQVRELDQSGLVTIASHTIDHLSLSSQSIEVQRKEIIDGKHQLEAELGHPVRHFAYPYGSYNATTTGLVKEAGFVTAVSTLPGTIHTAGDLYTLHRVRSALKLP